MNDKSRVDKMPDDILTPRATYQRDTWIPHTVTDTHTHTHAQTHTHADFIVEDIPAQQLMHVY